MNYQERIFKALTEAERPKGTKNKRGVRDITGRDIPARTGHQFSANARSYDRRGDQSKAAAAKNDSYRNPEKHYTIHASGLRSKRTGEPIARRRR